VRGFSSMGVSRRIEELLLFGFGAIVLP
jgi:hypothetical protein